MLMTFSNCLNGRSLDSLRPHVGFHLNVRLIVLVKSAACVKDLFSDELFTVVTSESTHLPDRCFCIGRLKTSEFSNVFDA